LDGTLFPPTAFPRKIMQDRAYGAIVAKKGWDRKRVEAEFRKRYLELGSNTKTLTTFGIDGTKFYTDLWDEIDLSSYLRPDPKLPLLFERLSGFPHFLLSNSNRMDQIERKLAILGILPSVFRFILSTVDIGAVKPDPKPFLVALERLAFEPSSVMYVGDRVSTDILGAKGVGMRTCFVWGEAAEADISLPTVYDVGELFTKLKVKS